MSYIQTINFFEKNILFYENYALILEAERKNG